MPEETQLRLISPKSFQEFPTTPSGQIQKFKLREMAMEMLDFREVAQGERA